MSSGSEFQFLDPFDEAVRDASAVGVTMPFGDEAMRIWNNDQLDQLEKSVYDDTLNRTRQYLSSKMQLTDEERDQFGSTSLLGNMSGWDAMNIFTAGENLMQFAYSNLLTSAAQHGVQVPGFGRLPGAVPGSVAEDFKRGDAALRFNDDLDLLERAHGFFTNEKPTFQFSDGTDLPDQSTAFGTLTSVLNKASPGASHQLDQATIPTQLRQLATLMPGGLGNLARSGITEDGNINLFGTEISPGNLAATGAILFSDPFEVVTSFAKAPAALARGVGRIKYTKAFEALKPADRLRALSQHGATTDQALTMINRPSEALDFMQQSALNTGVNPNKGFLADVIGIDSAMTAPSQRRLQFALSEQGLDDLDIFAKSNKDFSAGRAHDAVKQAEARGINLSDPTALSRTFSGSEKAGLFESITQPFRNMTGSVTSRQADEFLGEMSQEGKIVNDMIEASFQNSGMKDALEDITGVLEDGDMTQLRERVSAKFLDRRQMARQLINESDGTLDNRIADSIAGGIQDFEVIDGVRFEKNADGIVDAGTIDLRTGAKIRLKIDDNVVTDSGQTAKGAAKAIGDDIAVIELPNGETMPLSHQSAIRLSGKRVGADTFKHEVGHALTYLGHIAPDDLRVLYRQFNDDVARLEAVRHRGAKMTDRDKVLFANKNSFVEWLAISMSRNSSQHTNNIKRFFGSIYEMATGNKIGGDADAARNIFQDAIGAQAAPINSMAFIERVNEMGSFALKGKAAFSPEVGTSAHRAEQLLTKLAHNTPDAVTQLSLTKSVTGKVAPLRGLSNAMEALMSKVDQADEVPLDTFKNITEFFRQMHTDPGDTDSVVRQWLDDLDELASLTLAGKRITQTSPDYVPTGQPASGARRVPDETVAKSAKLRKDAEDVRKVIETGNAGDFIMAAIDQRVNDAVSGGDVRPLKRLFGGVEGTNPVQRVDRSPLTPRFEDDGETLKGLVGEDFQLSFSEMEQFFDDKGMLSPQKILSRVFRDKLETGLEVANEAVRKVTGEDVKFSSIKRKAESGNDVAIGQMSDIGSEMVRIINRISNDLSVDLKQRVNILLEPEILSEARAISLAQRSGAAQRSSSFFRPDLINMERKAVDALSTRVAKEMVAQRLFGEDAAMMMKQAEQSMVSAMAKEGQDSLLFGRQLNKSEEPIREIFTEMIRMMDARDKELLFEIDQNIEGMLGSTRREGLRKAVSDLVRRGDTATSEEIAQRVADHDENLGDMFKQFDIDLGQLDGDDLEPLTELEDLRTKMIDISGDSARSAHSGITEDRVFENPIKQYMDLISDDQIKYIVDRYHNTIVEDIMRDLVDPSTTPEQARQTLKSMLAMAKHTDEQELIAKATQLMPGSVVRSADESVKSKNAELFRRNSPTDNRIKEALDEVNAQFRYRLFTARSEDEAKDLIRRHEAKVAEIQGRASGHTDAATDRAVEIARKRNANRIIPKPNATVVNGKPMARTLEKSYEDQAVTHLFSGSGVSRFEIDESAIGGGAQEAANFFSERAKAVRQMKESIKNQQIDAAALSIRKGTVGEKVSIKWKKSATSMDDIVRAQTDASLRMAMHDAKVANSANPEVYGLSPAEKILGIIGRNAADAFFGDTESIARIANTVDAMMGMGDAVLDTIWKALDLKSAGPQSTRAKLLKDVDEVIAGSKADDISRAADSISTIMANKAARGDTGAGVRLFKERIVEGLRYWTGEMARKGDWGGLEERLGKLDVGLLRALANDMNVKVRFDLQTRQAPDFIEVQQRLDKAGREAAGLKDDQPLPKGKSAAAQKTRKLYNDAKLAAAETDFEKRIARTTKEGFAKPELQKDIKRRVGHEEVSRRVESGKGGFLRGRKAFQEAREEFENLKHFPSSGSVSTVGRQEGSFSQKSLLPGSRIPADEIVSAIKKKLSTDAGDLPPMKTYDDYLEEIKERGGKPHSREDYQMDDGETPTRKSKDITDPKARKNLEMASNYVSPANAIRAFMEDPNSALRMNLRDTPIHVIQQYVDEMTGKTLKDRQGNLKVFNRKDQVLAQDALNKAKAVLKDNGLNDMADRSLHLNTPVVSAVRGVEDTNFVRDVVSETIEDYLGVKRGALRKNGVLRSIAKSFNFHVVNAQSRLYDTLKEAGINMTDDVARAIVEKGAAFDITKDWRALHLAFQGFSNKVEEAFINGMITPEGHNFVAVRDGKGYKWEIKSAADMTEADNAVSLQWVRAAASDDGMVNFAHNYAVALRREEKLSQGLDILGEKPDEYMVDALEVAKRAYERGTDAFRAEIDEILLRERHLADTYLEYGLRAGRFSKQFVDTLRAENKMYIDLHRVFHEQGNTAINHLIKSMDNPNRLHSVEGSSRMIDNPLVNTGRQVYNIMHDADKNQMFRTLIDTMLGAGENQRLVRKLDAREAVDDTTGKIIPGQLQGKDAAKVMDQRGDTIKIYRDGKAEWYEATDPSIIEDIEMLAGLQGSADNIVIKSMTFVANVVRATVVNSPGFAIRNLIRDNLQRLGGGSDEIRGAGDLASSIKEGVFMDDAAKRQFKLSGGSQEIRGEGGNRITGIDGWTRELRKHLAGGKTAKANNIFIDTPNRIVELGERWSDLMSRPEMWSRQGEFTQAFKNIKKKHPNVSDELARMYAGIQSRELLNYSRMGRSMKVANQMIPFLNASIQGTRRLFKRIHGQPAAAVRQNMTQFMTYIVGTEVAVNLYNQAMGNGKEYDAQPDHMKDFFWSFKVPGADNLWIRIPKPFEMGVLASGVGRAINGDSLDEYIGGWMPNLMKGMLPVDEGTFAGPLRPVVESLTNYDLFRNRAIVNPFEASLDVRLRRGTINASKLGQGIQDLTGVLADFTGLRGLHVDARKVDHFASGFGGDWARGIQMGSDIVHGLATGSFDRPISKARVANLFTGLTAEGPGGLSKQASEVRSLAKALGKTQAKELNRFKDLSARYFRGDDATREKLGTQLIDESERVLNIFQQPHMLRDRLELRDQAVERELTARRLGVPTPRAKRSTTSRTRQRSRSRRSER